MRKNDAIFIVNVHGSQVISFGTLLAPKGVNIQHKVKVGGGSFTDGKLMETGLPEFLINDEEDEFDPTFKVSDGLYVLKGLTAHEYGHVWFTRFKDYSKFIMDYSEKFVEAGINENFAMKIVSHILNCTEDGRIEKRMVNLYPGLLNYFRFLNGTMWKLDSEELPEDELNNFLRCIVSYSVIGLKPRWYKQTKGTRLRDEFQKIEKLIDDCINSKTCKQNTEITKEIIDTNFDYLLELMIEKQKNQPDMEDLINQLGEGDIAEGLEGLGDGSGKGSGSLSSRLGDSKSGEGEEEDDEAGTGTSEGDSEEDKEEGEAEGNKKEEENIGDNSGASYDSTGRKSKAEEYSDTKEMATGTYEKNRANITGDGGGSTKTIKSKEKHKSIEEKVDEMLKEVSVSSEKELEETEKKKEPESKPSALSKEEIAKIVTSAGYDKESIRTYREEKEKYPMLELPDKLRPDAIKFKKEVDKCFKEKNTRLSNMDSGRIDCKKLHKIGMKEYNIFQKVANRSDSDAVVEICWDGSGSMCGGKQNLSGEACAIIEYGLKSVIPMKIINFSTDWSDREVVHYLVKDFNDNKNQINYSISYTKSKGFTGGNKDGYSIRVCTEDLMKRPEKDKILIVLSDGLPSDYNSINPEDDVKDAVKCARRKGVIVIPIFFGDDYFRESAISAYEYMYEKNIINSSPEELGVRLVKILKSLVLK